MPLTPRKRTKKAAKMRRGGKALQTGIVNCARTLSAVLGHCQLCSDIVNCARRDGMDGARPPSFGYVITALEHRRGQAEKETELSRPVQFSSVRTGETQVFGCGMTSTSQGVSGS